MKSRIQKRMAASLLGVSKKRITLDLEALEDIKEAITKSDIRGLIKDGGIIRKQKKGISRKKNTKRSGPGSRKGKSTARTVPKRTWINRARAQRKLIRELRDKGKITPQDFRILYLKIKGGYFRSRRHIKLYISEHNMMSKK